MPQGKSFGAKYKAKWNQDVVLYAPQGYDAFNVFVAAMKKAGSADPAKFLPELAKIDYEGIRADPLQREGRHQGRTDHHVQGRRREMAGGRDNRRCRQDVRGESRGEELASAERVRFDREIRHLRVPFFCKLDILLQQLINGVTLGSVYALVALGYTMVYGIIGLINFAHGELVMVGAMGALSVIRAARRRAGLPPVADHRWPRWSCHAGLHGRSGTSIERVAYRPLRRAPRLAPLITAIGVSIMLQNVAHAGLGQQVHRVAADRDAGDRIDVGGATDHRHADRHRRLAAALMGGLLLHRAAHRASGRAMRATEQNPDVAGLMGVDTEPHHRARVPDRLGAGGRRRPHGRALLRHRPTTTWASCWA